MDKRLLLISPEPYRTDSSSRCLGSFFCGWERACIAQIYTSAIIPLPGFCDKYYRITDKDVLKSRLKRNNTGGIVSVRENGGLEPNIETEAIDFTHKVKSFFKNKNSFYHLLRMGLWGKTGWKSKSIDKWVDEFDPEIIFLDLGQDNILANIALSISYRKGIPIVTFLPDDFYFNKNNIRKSIIDKLYIRLLSKKMGQSFFSWD